MLKTKISFISGAGQGIGAAIAMELAQQGAWVGIADINSDQAHHTLTKIIENGGQGKIFTLDISNFQQVQRVVDQLVNEMGRLDILVNNAGINRDGVIWKMTEEQWDQVLDVNLKGYFNVIRAAVPWMKDKNYGKIINITSINGMRGKFGQANYSAAKAGIIGLTKTLAKELGRFNVNVNAIAPGLIETEMMRTADASVRENAINEIVLGRMGQAEDIAHLVAFLASDKARHITGEVIKVDGGQYI